MGLTRYETSILSQQKLVNEGSREMKCNLVHTFTFSPPLCYDTSKGAPLVNSGVSTSFIIGSTPAVIRRFLPSQQNCFSNQQTNLFNLVIAMNNQHNLTYCIANTIEGLAFSFTVFYCLHQPHPTYENLTSTNTVDLTQNASVFVGIHPEN